MKEENGLDGALDKVQEVVVAPDVSELMGENGPELVRSEGGEGRDRDEHYGSDPAHDHRRLCQGAL